MILQIFAQLLDSSTKLPQASPDRAGPVIINIVFSIIGAIALLIIVISGFRFVISSGEPEKVAKARQSIIYAVVGLVVTISAAAILNFVISSVVK